MSQGAAADAEKFLKNMSITRTQVPVEFALGHPDAVAIIAKMFEYLGVVTYTVSGVNIEAIPHGHYILGLTWSFIRTHYIAVELVTSGFLVESATLVRKQLELMARLQEITEVGEGDLSHLLKRTPNVKNLQSQIKSQYSQLSEIAHSATSNPILLMGHLDVDGRGYHPLFPIASDDQMIALNHLVLSMIEFLLWSRDFLPTHYGNFDKSWADQWVVEFVPIMMKAFPSEA